MSESFVYYDVEPSGVNDLLAEINRRSPITEDDHVYHGHTGSRVDWRFWWRDQGSYCQITQVEVNVTVTFTMPRLRSNNSDVLDIWHAWYPQLLQHEELHRDIALEAARDIELQLPSFSAATCSDLAADANQWAQQRIADMRQQNRDYDDETRHGGTQGAWLSDYLP
ncbi:DUF922 domain-containing Zn-dependent protease [Parathalassolituus penaei]|uniref:DUF922 domain-containing protein n=1 Tax=Parathalassolituus penaei TaxID=2997323 RepID=A0A9X3EIC1_9GAMM|nr:DUF922 domain-containing protein [Parathalassolituus penaei]MCY0967279.1 DUF922 domain-containing protein [Parathalassolituus penaei]